MLPKKISDEECRDNAEKNSADYNEEAFLHKGMVRPFWSMTAFHSPRASRVTTFFLFCARLWAS